MLLPSPLFANSVYQCTVDGVSTFSQTPCDDEYKQIDVMVGSGGDVKESDNNAECVDYLISQHKFNNPDSILIESSQKIWMTDDSGARQVLILGINSKNIHGMYAGAKSYRCFLNHDGSQLSKIQYLIK
jgi:hypothetical protein